MSRALHIEQSGARRQCTVFLELYNTRITHTSLERRIEFYLFCKRKSPRTLHKIYVSLRNKTVCETYFSM
jgi:hypothetical protein